MAKNTGKVREKSGNFVSPEKWEPWHGCWEGGMHGCQGGMRGCRGGAWLPGGYAM